MKAYQINMKSDTEAEVNMYGEVVDCVPLDFWTGEPVEGLFIALDTFIDDIKNLKDMKKVTFRINSVGGDAHAGVTIYNRIRELSAETITIVDGLAASAASIIAQAGDTRIMNVGTQMMVHGASTFMYGYYNDEDLSKTKKMLSTVNKSMAGIYAKRSGRDTEDILSMMKQEKWLTPDEAKEEGLCDEVWGRDVPKATTHDDTVIVNGITHRLHGMKVPKMKFMAKEETMEKVEDLRAKYPDLVDEIVSETKKDMDERISEALTKDRERMKAIDSIANQVGDETLVSKAKYDEPMTAEQLALIAMQNQAKAGASFMEKRMAETSVSVNPEPVDGSQEDTRNKAIADGAALIAGATSKGGK